MPPTFFPLRWESTGDQWWYASPIDWVAANGHYDLVRELLDLYTNLLIKLTSLRRIHRLETVWDDEEQFNDVAKCRSQVAQKLLMVCENKEGHNSLIRAGYGGWLLYNAASAGDVGFKHGLLKVLVAKSQAEGLQAHLRSVVEGLLNWQDSTKNHFKAKVKLLLGMLVKKCGLDAVKAVMPEEHMKLLTNIRKIKERKERKLAANFEETRSHLSKATTSRQPATAKKSPAVGAIAPSNPVGKAGNKKGGTKDPKQGNIRSFFKKV